MMDGPSGPLPDGRGRHRGGPLPPGDGPAGRPHPGGRPAAGLVLRRLAAHARSPTPPPACPSPFADADPDLLSTDPACWTLEPGAAWHGFQGLTDGYCLLDPIKVTITCPGADAAGGHARLGHPRPDRRHLPAAARHRRGEDRRPHAAGAVLHGHHQGQVGHADRRADRLQARLRRRPAPGRGAAGLRAAGHHAAPLLRRGARQTARPRPRRAPRPDLHHAAPARPHPRRHATRP